MPDANYSGSVICRSSTTVAANSSSIVAAMSSNSVKTTTTFGVSTKLSTTATDSTEVLVQIFT